MVTELFKRLRRGYTDVLGLDLATTGAKAVRLHKTAEGVTLVAADLLPPVVLPGMPGSADTVSPLALPRALRAKYVALCVSGPAAVVKLLTLPAHGDRSGEPQIHESLGLDDSVVYRVGYEPLGETEPRGERRLLAVALPENQARALPLLFPHGTPAPAAIEISGLCSLTSFAHGPGRQHTEECVMVVDFGAVVSMVAIFSRGTLALVRKFELGTAAVVKRVQDNLGVDEETARGILVDGSFDVSQVVHQTLEGFTQQLILSRNFVERREEGAVRKLYVCGGTPLLRDWLKEVHALLGLESASWDPFEGLRGVPDAIPERWRDHAPRFTAAVGAALGLLEER